MSFCPVEIFSGKGDPEETGGNWNIVCHVVNFDEEEE